MDEAAAAALQPRDQQMAIVPIPWWKQVLDLTVAGIGLLLAAPVLLVAAALIRLETPGPALFRDARIGQGERPFAMFKLRTMRIDANHTAHRAANLREIAGDRDMAEGGLFKSAADARVTRIGRVLRRFSLDELPQLINVLRGEMSLVGPRPSAPYEVASYTPAQRRRHVCRPGMTGLWQVSGRNRLSMPEMFALDLAYVERQTFWLDLQILLRTPAAVLSGDGAV